MDRLPPELLRTILLASVGLCRCEKNELLPLRLVCKGFDAILKEYIFRTIQLEFSRFARGEAAPELESIAGIGQLCEALYCDMMVIRDEGMFRRPFRPYLQSFVSSMSFAYSRASSRGQRSRRMLPSRMFVFMDLAHKLTLPFFRGNRPPGARLQQHYSESSRDDHPLGFASSILHE